MEKRIYKAFGHKYSSARVKRSEMKNNPTWGSQCTFFAGNPDSFYPQCNVHSISKITKNQFGDGCSLLMTFRKIFVSSEAWCLMNWFCSSYNFLGILPFMIYIQYECCSSLFTNNFRFLLPFFELARKLSFNNVFF